MLMLMLMMMMMMMMMMGAATFQQKAANTSKVQNGGGRKDFPHPAGEQRMDQALACEFEGAICSLIHLQAENGVGGG